MSDEINHIHFLPTIEGLSNAINKNAVTLAEAVKRLDKIEEGLKPASIDALGQMDAHPPMSISQWITTQGNKLAAIRDSTDDAVIVDKEDLRVLRRHFIAFELAYQPAHNNHYASNSELKIYLEHINELLKKYGV